MVSAILRNRQAALVRVNVDIADYKKQHAEKIADKARGWIEEVRRTGETKIIELNSLGTPTAYAAYTEDDYFFLCKPLHNLVADKQSATLRVYICHCEIGRAHV